jgi:nanoRNase/pAp phosphatase (c-di-AMP/oligoRNAs hydrolase)
MRLLTRSDFDGMACAVLLKDVGLINSYRFVHPKDIQDGKIEVSEHDVLANVPYVKGCGLWFDHHTSEQSRVDLSNMEFEGCYQAAPSCARVIWDFYDGDNTFDEHFHPMMEAVDKVDSGDLNADDIQNPSPWILLAFLLDPRTGLGRFRDFRLTHQQLQEEMVEQCRNRSIEEIFELADIKERTERYYEQTELFCEMVKQRAYQTENIIVMDLREQEKIHAGNRFAIYPMFPTANVSIQVMWGFQRQNIVISCGYSIINRTCTANIGELMHEFGGGGHKQVGGCQVPIDKADEVLQKLISRIKEPIIPPTE